MNWCHQATSHYLNQCWPSSKMPYGFFRLQWVNSLRCTLVPYLSWPYPLWVPCPYHSWLLWRWRSCHSYVPCCHTEFLWSSSCKTKLISPNEHISHIDTSPYIKTSYRTSKQSSGTDSIYRYHVTSIGNCIAGIRQSYNASRSKWTK